MTQIETLQEHGIHRVGSPKHGFVYRFAQGRTASHSEVARIQSLALPPAWKDVAIAASSGAKVQALGMDQAGRWQYRYHPSFVRKQETAKYERILDFARTLPAMRASIRKGLSRPGLGEERVMACILQILSVCFIRAGSQRYADEHGSYGIATLLKRHVQVRGDIVVFDYRGKSGKDQHRELNDRRVANVIRGLCKSAPGTHLFQYQDAAGAWVDIRRQHINTHIKDVMGRQFTAKDFRSWAGTLLCACALARGGVCADDSGAVRRRKIVAAIKETATYLGNTPAICRSSYVAPMVLSAFEQGRVMKSFFGTVAELEKHRGDTLHRSERALLNLLRPTR